MLSFRKTPAAKKFRHKKGREEEVSRLSIEFCWHSTKTFRRVTLPGFRKVLLSKLFMHRRGRGGITIFPNNKWAKNVGEGWDSNLYLQLQNPVLLPTVLWELLEFLTNVSEIINIFGTTETRSQTYRFSTLLSYPLCHGNHWGGILDKCQWILENIWHNIDSNLDLLLKKHLSQPPMGLTTHRASEANY